MSVRVRCLRVGEVRVRPDNVRGTWRPPLLWTLTSRTWSDWLPVHAYLVELPGATVLFDTGQDPASVEDPEAYYPSGPIGWVYHRQAEFRVAHEERVDRQLQAAGVEPEQVSHVVLSHLHQDHVGGVGRIPDAAVLVAADELALLDAKNPYLHGVMPEHVRQPGVDYVPVRFRPTSEERLAPFTSGHDVVGDGSLTLLPTPGHSAGSLSMLVERGSEGPPLLLVGDVTYDARLLALGIVPGTGARRQQQRTHAQINELTRRRPGLVVLSAHDPRAEELVQHS